MLIVSLTAILTEAVLIPMGSSKGGYVGLAIAFVGVALARRYLWLGVALTAIAPLIDALLGKEPLVLWTIAIFTAMSVTLRGLPAVGVALTVAVPVYGAIVRASPLGFVDPVAFTAVAFAFAASATGSAVRNRYGYWLEREQRARDEIANREADVTRRITEERLRIARDLHDVVGHEVAVLGIHLGVLEVTLPADAGEARASLEAARSDVQAILHETQRILQVLRTDGSVASDGDDRSRPAPDFTGIEGLVSSRRASGVLIDATICDVPDRLDPEVSTAAFRIVQEALTNFQRHGTGTLSLSIRAEAGMLTITASNTKSTIGTGQVLARGYGLIGMRERASSAGGRLIVDDTGRTFTVTAIVNLSGSVVR